MNGRTRICDTRRVYISFGLTVSADCVGCQSSMPINGILASLNCSDCGTLNALDHLWSLPHSERFGQALALEGDAERTLTTLGRAAVRFSYGRRLPRCNACGAAELDPTRLAEQLATGACGCPRCGAAIQVRAADPLCLQVQPRTRFLVGESSQDAAARAVAAATTPVRFACMGCGASLAPDGSTRAVTCSYCRSSNYLPDGVWQLLRPKPVPQPFYLVCEYDEASLITARWDDEDVRVADAARSDLPPDLYATLASDDESTVRAALASNPAAPHELLARLARDPDDDVLERLASNPATPAATLAHLADHDNSRVVVALARHPGLTAPILTALATHARAEQRKAVIGHPALPLDSLHKLARDDDDDVNQRARARLAELRAQGVDVDAGRGFFKRLFG